jgi:hypothetical protein
MQIKPGEDCPAGMTEIRPNNCLAPASPPPSIVDYRPKSTLIVPAAGMKWKAKYPVVDFHGHPSGLLGTADGLTRLGASMDSVNVRLMIAADNVSGDRLQRTMELVNGNPSMKNRVRLLTGINLNGVGPGWAAKAVAQLEADVKGGAVGIGEIGKGFGLSTKKADGTRLRLNDPDLDPIWEAAARLKLPVFIHTADPQEFFRAVDNTNERWLELTLFPERLYPQDRYPSFNQLMAERDSLFLRHPKTTFVAAHLGWHANDLGRLGRMFDKMPNVLAEVGAVLYDIGRQPRSAHDFFVKYQDRLLFGKDSFQPIHTPEEGEEYLLKPMNCPHHCEIYKSQPRSYRDLPLRFAEFGTVYRYEQSGELHGLTRVRGFTQDDAHLFCTPDQLLDEFLKVIDLVLYIFKTLDFPSFKAQVSLRDPNNPSKYIGSAENWEKAENAILEAAKIKELPHVIEYGEAAFYGPKLDFMVRDAIGREWQLGTIQVDYNLPERFELEYKGADNEMHRPVMIHRAPFGSMERFVAVLIEHCGGNVPLWLTPEQAVVLPVSERFNEYAQQVVSLLEMSDIRALVDDRNEKVGRKIRDAEMRKVPFMLVVGEKEQESQTVSVRRHGEGDLGAESPAEFAERVRAEVAQRLSAL